ncbi:hypothetical protein Nepgr_022978 [Nepenthes gracilis]|uniref:Uncharacterized protein n=1 Tax=Nepenthes gracilis TaxID=150966 RepID=A0AAD3XYX6_NEPGR|nr:hypothetical protein Nepgr_022978 [Nepenthes gracilis]
MNRISHRPNPKSHKDLEQREPASESTKANTKASYCKSPKRGQLDPQRFPNAPLHKLLDHQTQSSKEALQTHPRQRFENNQVNHANNQSIYTYRNREGRQQQPMKFQATQNNTT